MSRPHLLPALLLALALAAARPARGASVELAKKLYEQASPSLVAV